MTAAMQEFIKLVEDRQIVFPCVIIMPRHHGRTVAKQAYADYIMGVDLANGRDYTTMNGVVVDG